jgi:hypothetical protein
MSHELRIAHRVWLVVVLMFGLAVFPGCASYFRTGERSAEELKEQNKQAKEQKAMEYKPGTTIYTH